MERESIKVLNELDSMIAELKASNIYSESDALRISLTKLREKYSGNGDNVEKV